MKVHIPVIIAGLSTKVDGSIKIVLETREFPADDAAKVFSLRNKEAWAILSPTEMDDSVIPKDKPDPVINKKTPSERLYNVMYVLWKQKGEHGDFDTFYKQQMERIIETIKSKLEPKGGR